jgi:hypothetical protein
MSPDKPCRASSFRRQAASPKKVQIVASDLIQSRQYAIEIVVHRQVAAGERVAAPGRQRHHQLRR